MDVVFEYRKLLFDGTLVTIALALSSLSLSVLCGLGGAFLKLSTSKSLQKLGNIYIQNPPGPEFRALAPQCIERIMRRASRAKRVRAIQKILLIDRLQQHRHSALQ